MAAAGTDRILSEYHRVLSGAGFGRVAGVDEAGRGACAGPLVAASVVLNEEAVAGLPGLTDSKLLTPSSRERIHDQILALASDWAVVIVEPQHCDELGVHQANLIALRQAVLRLPQPPDFVVVDGFDVAGLGIPSLAVWKGDRVVPQVSAASVLAKVTRDRMMVELHQEYPEYGFDKHKGYITSHHQSRLELHGPSPVHRLSYRNVQRVLSSVSPQ